MLIFCLPFSKALIEISATAIIVSWLIKRVVLYVQGDKTGVNRPLLAAFRPAVTYLDLAIALYIIATLFSVLFSSNVGLSVKNFFSKTMEYILLFFIVAEAIGTQKNTSIGGKG